MTNEPTLYIIRRDNGNPQLIHGIVPEAKRCVESIVTGHQCTSFSMMEQDVDAACRAYAERVTGELSAKLAEANADAKASEMMMRLMTNERDAALAQIEKIIRRYCLSQK